jgi:hypothetical protein
VGSGYVGPLDLVSNAALAVSIARLLTVDYGSKPLVKLRADNGDTLEDFTHDASGLLDTAAIAAWMRAAGASCAYIHTLYDQSGNGRNLTQLAKAAQPLFVAGVQGGRAGMRFNGSSTHLSNRSLASVFSGSGTPLAIVCALKFRSLAAPHTIWALGNPGVDNQFAELAASDTPNYRAIRRDDACILKLFMAGTPVTTSFRVASYSFDGTTLQFFINSTQVGDDADLAAGPLTACAFTVGARLRATAVNYMDGDILELLVYPSLTDTSRQTLENNTASCYGISFTGAGGQDVTMLDLPAAGEFSIVFLPDSQDYSERSPRQFAAQTRWIVDNHARYNIQAVLHVGDVVNRNQPEQWANADAAIRILDAADIPYLIAIGNHDYDTKASAERLATAFNATFPPERFTAHAWWHGGFYEAGHTENGYCLLSTGGVDYLLLNLEFGPRQAVIDWANALLDRYPDRWVILITHSFLYIDGTRVSEGDRHNPKQYRLGATANDGEDLWAKLVSRHDNIHWVQSGHHVGANAAYRRDESRGGTTVHQVFANWQQTANGGDGWLRIVTFGRRQARVQTFSTTLGRVNSGADHKFSVTL